jgi:hypothetical protein
MNLDDLMSKFKALGKDSWVGRGPQHPTDPNLNLAALTQQWLDVHPFLFKDPEYVLFLQCYSGAEIDQAGNGFGIAIAGFSGFGGNLHELGPGKFDASRPCLTEDGFYPFATCCGTKVLGDFKTFVAIEFSFDATGNRQWGVYRSMSRRHGAETKEHMYCGTFLEWLERAIELRGRVL